MFLGCSVVIISAEKNPAQNNFYLPEPFDITVWAGIDSHSNGVPLFHPSLRRVSGGSMSRETQDSGRKKNSQKHKFWILKIDIGARALFLSIFIVFTGYFTVQSILIYTEIHNDNFG